MAFALRLTFLQRAARGLATGLALAATALAAPPEALRVATFDSGFGGYLTAKSIEGVAPSLLREYDASISIHHYGDTQNLPYGEKSPSQLVTLGSAGVLRAFQQGADMVFIACNTASTQVEGIRKTVQAAYPGQSKPIVSIIDASTVEARRLLDATLASRRAATFTILATPATVRSMVYPRGLAASYGVSLQAEAPKVFTQPRWNRAKAATIDSLVQRNLITLPDGRRIEVVQLAPANWVELIELGGSAQAKAEAITRDLGLLKTELKGVTPDVVGYFCTHYPIWDGPIRAELGQGPTRYISQGQLMADLFVKMAKERLQGHRRVAPLGAEQLQGLVAASRANITISGKNGAVTRELVRTLYPKDPMPVVTEEDLGHL